MCLNEVWSLAREPHCRQGSPIGCHHSSMTPFWQQACVHSVLPGFACTQSSVVACQTKWRGICIVVSLLVPFTRPVPLPSHISASQCQRHFDSVVLNSYRDRFYICLQCDTNWWPGEVINEMALSVPMLNRCFVLLSSPGVLSLHVLVPWSAHL